MSLIDIKDLDIQALKGITQDSRKVQPGYLFAALPGSLVDGAEYIDQAIEAGATAILAAQDVTPRENVQFIKVHNPRLALAHIAAQYYGAQPEHISAVTGTNGKTSVVTFVEQFWQVLNISGASLGTLSGNMTTPDSVSLHAHLAETAKQGITHLAMEASSHGLDQYRLDGVALKVAGFTNLSRDHLDYHKTMEAYLEAKARLFSGVLVDDGVAVLNADCPEFKQLHEVCEARGIKILSYGQPGADLGILSSTPTPQGLDVSLNIMGQDYDLTIPLVGAFQLMNLLCALGMVIAEDIKNTERTNKLVQSMAHVKGVRGRVESVNDHPQNAGIFVDYAHTPDALETVLKSLRPHTKGRMVCLFGCGGDRDPGKRPMMAEAVMRHADIGILTDDNPRSEDPDTIRTQAQVGAPEVENIAGREAAIQYGVNMLQPGDVLVITGKGHEQGQIFKDHVEPFDDVEEAEKAIQKYQKQKENHEECKE